MFIEQFIVYLLNKMPSLHDIVQKKSDNRRMKCNVVIDYMAKADKIISNVCHKIKGNTYRSQSNMILE